MPAAKRDHCGLWMTTGSFWVLLWRPLSLSFTGNGRFPAMIPSARVSQDVTMDQASTTVLDHHEHVQRPERGGDGNEIVAGNDSLGVKAQERRPAQVASRSAWGEGAHRPDRSF
jgi:hypothetical protein